MLDTVIALRRPSDYSPDQGARFEVHFDKSRGIYGDDVKPLEAQLDIRDDAAQWTFRPLEDVERQRVIRLKAEGLSIRDIAEETRIPRSTVHRIIKAAIAAGEAREFERFLLERAQRVR